MKLAMYFEHQFHGEMPHSCHEYISLTFHHSIQLHTYTPAVYIHTTYEVSLYTLQLNLHIHFKVLNILYNTQQANIGEIISQLH